MESRTTVIIGAGQAGLAMSRELSLRGVDHVVLDRGQVGEAWRTQRWDSLRLLTPNWANGLPGMPYTGPDPDGFMYAGEFVRHLQAYAASIEAPVQTHTEVHQVNALGSDYLVETSHGAIRASSLVLATGAFVQPLVPSFASEIPNTILQVTPSGYRRPDDLPKGGMLVVGASASGVQLAREIHLSGRPVTLAVGQHTRLPRTYRGYDIEWWLDVVGALGAGIDEIDDLERARHTPSPQLTGSGGPVDLNALQDIGAEIVGRFAAVRDGSALFSGGLAHVCEAADLKMNRLLCMIDDWIAENGLSRPTDSSDDPAPTRVPERPRLYRSLTDGGIRSILWATGSRPDFSWLRLPVFDQRGRLKHHGGVVDAPGLYVLGLPVLRRRRSHQISGAGDDARDLADHLYRHLSHRNAA